MESPSDASLRQRPAASEVLEPGAEFDPDGASEAATPRRRAQLPRARVIEEQAVRRQQAKNAPKVLIRRFKQVQERVKIGALIVALVVSMLFAGILYSPLRVLMDQRDELAALTADIQQQELNKAKLKAELARLQDPDYIKEMARTRLGLVEPGETAYRIISPRISATPGAQDLGKEQPARKAPWFQQLWNSIAVPRPVEDPQHAGVPEDHKLPVAPPG